MRVVTLILALVAALVLYGWSRALGDAQAHRAAQEWAVGGVYSVNAGGGQFGVVKVIAQDELAVHVRLYAAGSAQRPTAVPDDDLSLVAEGDGPPGLPHAPLARGVFASWQPELVRVAEVSPAELEPYLLWQRLGGGVWSD